MLYFPFLRGKMFELQAVLNVDKKVFNNTLPIIEPVNFSQKKLYKNLISSNIPFIFIVNPFYPVKKRISDTSIQEFINDDLSPTNVKLGFLIDNRFEFLKFQKFLKDNDSYDKVIIFKNDPPAKELLKILQLIKNIKITYLIFDELNTDKETRESFVSMGNKVLLTDGFNKKSRNADYPLVSKFSSNFNKNFDEKWKGIGDYLTIGDSFSDGGGQVYVVTLHVSTVVNNELEIRHFSSETLKTTKGSSPIKFSEANESLVTSRHISGLSSSGLDIFRDLYSRSHNPPLGLAKQASIMHHIELMSSII